MGVAARLVVLAVAGGIAFDLGLRGGLPNLIVAVGVGLVVAALLVDRRVTVNQSRWLALAALLPAALLAVRASPWLVGSNWLAVMALLTVAVVQARSGSVLDTSPSRLLVRGLGAFARSFRAPLLLRPLLRRLLPRPSGETWSRAVRVISALGIALPLLALVVALLAAADPVFAGMVELDLDVDLGPLPGHLFLVGFFAAAVLAIAAASDGDTRGGPWRGGLAALEIATMLGLAVAVLSLFVVSQLVALTDAGDRLVAEAGLTPAEYARSGFFQLCWAAVVLLGFLGLVRALAAREVLHRPAIRALGAAVPLLALGLVVVSLRRMALYDEAFGLTMLRLWVVGAAIWMGAVLVMVALRNAGVGRGRDWVLGGAGACALVLVLLANLANPEAFVVRHNVDRAGDGAELDVAYLEELSDDAVPALVDAVQSVDEPDDVAPLAAFVLECHYHEDAVGAEALNLSVARAEAALDEHCPDTSVRRDQAGAGPTISVDIDELDELLDGTENIGPTDDGSGIVVGEETVEIQVDDRTSY